MNRVAWNVEKSGFQKNFSRLIIIIMIQFFTRQQTAV